MKDLSSLLHSPTAVQWQQIGIKDHHGIAIPLFSIHSHHSYGVGEYTDLPPLIDWCASIGFDVIQLLPLNDTGLGKSPYSALSAFALNPLFIGLDALPEVQTDPYLKERLQSLPKCSKTPLVDYTKVRQHKDSFLHDYFRLYGLKTIESQEFNAFFVEAQSWLKGYAVFKILKEKHHQQNWEEWPETDRQSPPDLLDSIMQEYEEEFNYICFLQFLCDHQFKKAKAHANDQHVLLMGDIPILIGRDSADVWLHQELFNLNFSAGAPPDYFIETGQNWGFPIYNWDAMETHHFCWWNERLRWASRHYHMYRIDHIVGFFRIWSIPLGKSAKEGTFIPEEESLWIDHGQKILLMMIQASVMLPIGEDLGVVPPEVKKCLATLGICGTRVMRWERNWNSDRSFILPQDYDIESMTTLSTHDTETLQQWWRDHPEEAQLFAESKGWSYDLPLSRDHLKEILFDSHHSNSLFHINPLQEYLGLIPGLSWENPDHERINIPGLDLENNWSYRLKPSIEELEKQADLKYLIQQLIAPCRVDRLHNLR
ncbi:MAG: 4-alpha-glucanotransferase [Parachlamydiaceae bacterium]